MMEEVFTCDSCGKDFYGENIQTHPEECEYKSVLCDNGCGISTYQCEIHEHKTIKCTRRYVKCEHCQDKYFAIFMNDHYKRCPKMIIECPHNCGVNKIQREKLNFHLESTCSVNTVPCDFKYAQCQFKGTKIAVQKHLTESCSQHLILLGAMVVEQNRQLIRKDEIIKQTQTQILNLESNMKSSNELLQQTVGHLKNLNYISTTWNKKWESAEIKINRIHDWLTLIETKKLGQIINKSYQTTQQLASMKIETQKNVTQFVNRTDELQKTVDKLKLDCDRNLMMSAKQSTWICKKLTSIENEKLVEITRESTRIKEQLALMKAELVTLSENPPGVFIWKITGWAEKMRDAKTKKTTKLYSTEFHSSPHGYKLKMQLDPNGQRDGKGTHVSVFMFIVPGEYDSILSWPFRLNYTFSLLDQTKDKLNAEDIIMTITPTSDSEQVECWKQPDKTANTGGGCVKFISHEQLNNGKNINEDTIFIKFEIS